ncbi:protein trunk [Chironomus tepperi]|uniref:protein trunk n=1 Tax=Chironomus tepperi TaxID=113505 RepID=UPI00391F60DE
MQTKSESRTFSTKVKFNQKVIAKKEITSLNLVNDEKRSSIEPKKCDELSALVLNDILGAAFNSRYMSIDEPKIEEDPEPKNEAGKRGANDFMPFYVDDTYAMEISDMPAWEVQHLKNTTESGEIEEGTSNESQKRVQRSNFRRRTETEGSSIQQQSKRPWECEAKIKWLDLGFDYYPRYLRTVECTRHSCFYGHFQCKPRSFTVKILRRRRGECVQTKNKIGIEGLHGDLKELWVWEERAVNFCCDCAAK